MPDEEFDSVLRLIWLALRFNDTRRAVTVAKIAGYLRNLEIQKMNLDLEMPPDAVPVTDQFMVLREYHGMVSMWEKRRLEMEVDILNELAGRFEERAAASHLHKEAEHEQESRK